VEELSRHTSRRKAVEVEFVEVDMATGSLAS